VTKDQQRWSRLNEILERAVGLDGAARETYLVEVCGSDTELRHEIDRLLAYDSDRTGDLRDAVRAAAGRFIDEQDNALAGQRIGAWRVVSKIADGGMGSVVLAERADGGFEQQVAIKLLPRHLMAREANARFAEERRILASLEHPNVARLIDGGTLDDGVPWIAMEYVDGVSIDRWCDAEALSHRARIELVLQVCDAVGFAHRKLVIHRDIKPSNILVGADGIPKLLDFGIAKLVASDEGAAQEVTRAGMRALTPLYASPEQIEGQPITTAADVYGLGLLLYRLLTGRLPYVSSSTKPRDIERAILDATPERASRAVMTHAADTQAATGVDHHRWARQQQRALRGDLDLILATALRKEPERRYESVSAFAGDLRNYLAKLPIRARGDSVAYRIRKFVERNKLPVGLAAVFVSAAIGLTWYYTERLKVERATAEQTAAFLTELFEAPDPYLRRESPLTVAELLDRGAAQAESDAELTPVVRARLLTTMGAVYDNLGRIEDSARITETALQLIEAARPSNHVDVAATLQTLGTVRIRQGRYDEAVELLNRSLGIRERQDGPQSLPVAAVADRLYRAHYLGDDTRAMLDFAERAYDIRAALLPPDDPQQVTAASNLGMAHWHVGNTQQAEAMMTRAIEVSRVQPQVNEARLSAILHNLGLITWDLGDYRGAAAHYQQALELGQRALGDEHPQIPLTMYALAVAREFIGDYAGAGELYDGLVPLQKRLLGEVHDQVAFSLSGYGMLLERMGENEEAAATLEEARRIFEATVGLDHAQTGAMWIALGRLALARGDFSSAEGFFREALRVRGDSLNDDDLRVIRTRTTLGRVALARGEITQAITIFDAVIAAMEGRGDNDHLYVAEARGLRGQALLAGQNPGGAVDDLQYAIARQQEIQGAEHLDPIRNQLVLADALAAAGRLDEAENLRQVATSAERAVLARWSASRVPAD
jgi:serine/threonine-protein kinase